jgi:hypothetical protein
MRNAIFFGLWASFHFLFWQESFGINLVIFALGMHVASRLTQNSWSFKKGEWAYFIAFLVACFGLLWVNSLISIWTFALLNVAYLSFVWKAELSVAEHFMHGVMRLFNVSKPFLPEQVMEKSKPAAGALSTFKLLVFPILIFSAFFSLFRKGNPIFETWTSSFMSSFLSLFDGFSGSYFFFLLLGLMILRMSFLRTKDWPLKFQQGSFIRKGNRRGQQRRFKMNALHREFKMAVILFLSLNVLLAIVNFIDIRLFWFGFKMPAHFSLKEFLHEGVTFLMVSLLLASGLVFYYFRNNLNFYPKSAILKLLGRIWLIQNFILAISVFLRTYYYIDFHGLAHGRIAVIVLLIIVAIGLVLLHRKVSGARNIAYVFRHLSWYVMFIMVGLSAWDWDRSVVEHNLSHGRINEIDFDNYLGLSPRVFPILYANLDRIETQILAHQQNPVRWTHIESISEFRENLDRNTKAFLTAEEEQSWTSWNYGDARTYRQLKSN